MSIADNIVLVQRLFEEIWNQGNEDRFEELLTCMPYDGSHDELCPDTTLLRTSLRILRAALPDLHVMIDQMIGMPDRVLTQWHACGTHLGPFMGLPATGKIVSASGISIFYIANRRIQDARVSRDSLSMLQQVCMALTDESTPALVDQFNQLAAVRNADLVALEIRH